MFEGIVAWILLIYGILSGETLAYVASGAFAVATQIARITDRMDGKK